MKKLIYILLFNISAICFAQDPQLFENEWYLYKITIDNVDYTPPNLGDVDFNFHIFNENPYRLFTGYCDGIDVAVLYDNVDTTFLLEDNPNFLIGSCSFAESTTFNNQYFSIFYQNFAQAKNPFPYIITINDANKELRITNANGDSAFYGSSPLSVNENANTEFSIYPNPVKNDLLLNSNKKSGNLKIHIFNIVGKLLSNKTSNFKIQESIDVSNLSNGIYFLNIKDENGNIEVKKFIKE